MPAALLLATSAHAQAAPSSGPSLSWVRLPGAEACIAQAELAARIEARVGRPVFVRPADAIVLVEGRVAPSASGGFDAVIALSDRDGHGFGERALHLAETDCRKLDDIVALVITVTLRGGPSGLPLPDAIAHELEALFGEEPSMLDPAALPPTAEPSPPAKPAGELDRQERAPARQARSPGPALGYGLDAGMAVITGLQPSGTLAPSARVHVSLRGRGALALSAGLGLPQQMAIDDPTSGSGGTIELRAFFVALAVCTTAAQAFETALELCGHFGYGWLHAQAHGFVHDRASTQTWTEIGPELALQAPLVAPLRARIGVSLPIRLARPELTYQQHAGRYERAFQVAGIGVAGELALGVSLP
jgi:hypothetical protein